MARAYIYTLAPPNSYCQKGSKLPKGLFGKGRNQVDGRGLKGILGNFDL
jgi:hypothetical protein